MDDFRSAVHLQVSPIAERDDGKVLIFRVTQHLAQRLDVALVLPDWVEKFLLSPIDCLCPPLTGFLTKDPSSIIFRLNHKNAEE